MNKQIAAVCTVACMGCSILFAKETLPVLADDQVPQSWDALWQDFDPRMEPLETEVLKEWEDDGVVLRIVRFRIGIFKGEKAIMAGVYGFSKGRKSLPGLLQIHGGGQYAHSNAVFTNAKRGYATLSISWAGRIDAPDYRLNPDIVQLFWDEKTDDPDYKLTTDWGALDAYHAPSKFRNSYTIIQPAPFTMDQVDSPRNNSWFLSTLGARRGLTFLEQQPEVDGTRLGVYGHSMGGKLTVMTTGSDKRVKAAAPSCGGISDRHNESALFRATLSDEQYLERITCPILFLSPSNDFHGRINDLQKALNEIKSDEWRVTCSPHHSHQDSPEYEVAGPLWFDQQLKGTFNWPETPKSSLKLNTKSGFPSFSVTPDDSKQILYVDIYYTQQGQEIGEIEDRDNRVNRFWHHARSERTGSTWKANLPILSTDLPVWIYANVVYSLDEPVTGAGYYYKTYTADKFNLSSRMHVAEPDDLKAAGVKATMQPSLVIEDFKGDWGKEWFTYNQDDWARRTHKVYDGKWKAPEGAELAIDVRSENPNTLVVGLDGYAAVVQLNGGSDWQTVTLSPGDFRDVEGETMTSWEGLKELRLGAEDNIRKRIDGENTSWKAGAPWTGAKPQFRLLRWVVN